MSCMLRWPRAAARFIAWSFVVLAMQACGSLPDAGGGIVTLEITEPQSLSMPVDSPIVFQARALDSHGNAVAAQIVWRTPDTTVVTLDSISGVVVGKVPGSAQIQASIVTLRSQIIVITILPPYSGVLLLAASGLPNTGDAAQCTINGPRGPLGGGVLFSARMGDPPTMLSKLAPGNNVVGWVAQTIDGTTYQAAADTIQVSDSTAPVTATGAYH